MNDFDTETVKHFVDAVENGTGRLEQDHPWVRKAAGLFIADTLAYDTLTPLYRISGDDWEADPPEYVDLGVAQRVAALSGRTVMVQYRSEWVRA